MYLKIDVFFLKQQKFLFQMKSYLKTQFMEPIKRDSVGVARFAHLVGILEHHFEMSGLGEFC